MITPIRPGPTHQDGAVLVTGLVTLLLLTILGVTGMQVATLEERMAANARRRDLALHAAESALRAAEALLRESPEILSPNRFGCPPREAGLYLSNCSAEIPLWQKLEQEQGWRGPNASRTFDQELAQIREAPRYLIELVQRGGPLNDNLELPRPQPDTVVYRITARGVGPGAPADAVAIVQSTFLKAPP